MDIIDVKSPIIGVIIPFRNEEESLPTLLQSLRSTLESCSFSYEVILVDDGSNDSGWRYICGESKIHKCIKGIRLTRGFGKESAIRAGLLATSAKAAIIMDSDMQHPPELVPKMIQIWNKKNIPIIEAVKVKPSGKNFFNKCCSSILYSFIEHFAGIELKNRSDFQLIDRKVIDRINTLPERITFFRGIVSWFGFPSYKIPFEVKERVAGRTSWSLLNLVRLALDAITGFTTVPLRFVTACSAIFIALSFLLTIHTLYMKFSGRAYEGFTTVIICTLMVGGVITIGLGIIGEYLARIYEEIKQRPQFIIRETLNIKSERSISEKMRDNLF